MGTVSQGAGSGAMETTCFVEKKTIENVKKTSGDTCFP